MFKVFDYFTLYIILMNINKNNVYKLFIVIYTSYSTNISIICGL